MFTKSTPSSIDRRDEIVLVIIALLVPLVTLPALLGF
jgi:hypothetical protein